MAVNVWVKMAANDRNQDGGLTMIAKRNLLWKYFV